MKAISLEDKMQSSMSSEQRNAEQINMGISYESAQKCVPNDLYNHIAWMITGADEEIGSEGHVVLVKKKKKKKKNSMKRKGILCFDL